MISNNELKTSKKNYYLNAFLLGLVLAFIMFIPFIIVDGGRFLFYGDFNVQQIPFYQLAHDAVRSGNIGWSHLTDLGANFIGSYSFYLLGSPFFWLTIPFPTEAIQYLMGPLLILKFGCATLTGFIYLQRYVKNKDYAIIGALLYAFSGYSIYNIFFNHFHEAIVFLPLLLAALDEYMATKRKGVFALAVFACSITNYYFFVGQVMFCILYFFIKLFSGSYKIRIKDFSLLALEAVIGFFMSSILIVPSILAIVQNTRVDNYIDGWNAVLYSNTQRYLHIIQSFFFPPDLPARPNFTPDSNSKWSSLSAWLPLFGMTGTIAWLNISRKHWLKKLIFTIILCAFVPFLNSAFQMFNSNYYARWFYMATLMMSLATIMSLECNRVDWKKAIKFNVIVIVVISLIVGLTPTFSEDGAVDIGLESYDARYWSYIALTLICLGLLIILFRYVKKEVFAKITIVLLSVVSVFHGIFFIAIGKTQSQNPSEQLIPYALNGGADLTIEVSDSERTDFYKSLDNMGMFWQVPTIQTFHSIVPGSVMEFYDYIDVDRSVASRPETDHYALRGLTSVRWLFDDFTDEDYFAGEDFQTPIMDEFYYYGSGNGFDIWENSYYIPMGFTYDSYVLKSEADELSESNRERLMIKSAIIPDDDEALWSAILPKYEINTADLTKEKYQDDVMERRTTTAKEFSYTNYGFSATIDSGSAEALFFSVPFESGWSATVNGSPAEILVTNVGFMSVMIPSGENIKIEFYYSTPGLALGIVLTVVAVVIFLAYMFLLSVSSVKKIEVKVLQSTRKNISFEEYCNKTNVRFNRRTRKGYFRKVRRNK